MVFHQRLSTGPTLPELISAEADLRASAACAALPIAVWCRHSTLLVVRGHDGGLAPCRVALTPAARLPGSLRRASRAIAIRCLFLTASFVLVAARLLLRARLIRPGDAEPPLRWSSRLTQAGMRL